MKEEHSFLEELKALARVPLEELTPRQKIERMRAASSAFYRDAVRTGVHPFIEFTGLMNEYIALCSQALELGIDFERTHVHSGAEALPMAEHHGAYLGEKFGCIFEATFARHPEAKEAFLRAAGLK